LGFVAAIFAELLDNGFRTSAQLEQTLNLPVLATVPEMKGRKARSPVNIVNSNPLSAFVESLRGIQLGLTLADVDRPPKVILLTSAMPKEGKSTVALSLARLGVRNGRKVILLDCDLRRPNVLNLVKTEKPKNGLVNALLGKEPLDKCLFKDPESDVLLLVPEIPVKNPGDLLSSVAMENLIRDLRGHADWIIIDSAPLLPVNDTKLLIRSIDTVLFMARWEKTPRDAAAAAIRGLTDIRAPIAGVVMTRADSKRYNYYNYGSQNYSSYTRYYRT
jgi:capsular exopolysaccharide synthesis family protein